MQMVMGVGVELVTWGVLFASLLAEKAPTSAAPMPTVIHIVADGKKVRLRYKYPDRDMLQCCNVSRAWVTGEQSAPASGTMQYIDFHTSSA